MKFLVPNYSCLQNPRLGGYCLQILVLSVFCPQLKLLNPPPRTKFLGTPLPSPCVQMKISQPGADELMASCVRNSTHLQLQTQSQRLKLHPSLSHARAGYKLRLRSIKFHN